MGLFVEYNSNDFCEVFVFEKTATAHYHGINLMKQKSNYLHKKFGSISQNMEIEDEIGFTYYDLGFGFNVVFGTEDIQTLIIFPDDYW